ncbi:uncharacterized protein ACWYII_014448 [Salvelinus alpinus]
MFCADQNFDIAQVLRFFSSKHGELAIYYEQEEGEKSSSRGIVGVCSETHWITRFLEKSQEGVTALRLASVVFYCLYNATLPYLSDFLILQPQAQTGPSAGSGGCQTTPSGLPTILPSNRNTLPNLQHAAHINQSNVFIKPFLHQPMSRSAIQKPSLKPKTASNAEAWWLGKTP